MIELADGLYGVRIVDDMPLDNALDQELEEKNILERSMSGTSTSVSTETGLNNNSVDDARCPSVHRRSKGDVSTISPLRISCCAT